MPGVRDRTSNNWETHLRKTGMLTTAQEGKTELEGSCDVLSCLCALFSLFSLALLPKLIKVRIKNYLLEQGKLGRGSKSFFPLYNSPLLA